MHKIFISFLCKMPATPGRPNICSIADIKNGEIDYSPWVILATPRVASSTPK